MTTLLQDIRFGVRMLLKNPGFTFVAVLALALGIGANTAIFSIVNAVLLRPLPYGEPGKLVMVWMDNRAMGNKEDIHSYPNFVDYRDQNKVFETMAAYRNSSANLTGTGEPERILGAAATASFFNVMRVAPALGRVFTAEEDAQGRDRVIVLGHGLWQRRFGGDKGIVGKEISLNGANRTVLGVMPPDFKFPAKETDYWVPLAPPPAMMEQRQAYWLNIIGRLRPGVTFEGARAEMETIAKRLEAQYPEVNENFGVNLVTLQDQTVGQVRPALLILLGAVLFVLLIACANVANLLLSRASAREREFAIRTAMGAGRGRIVRQLLIESLLLAALSAVLGVLLAVWGLDALKYVLPGDMPRLDQIGVDGRVLAFTLGVSCLTAFLFGLAPAIHASNPNLNETLKEGGRSGSHGVRSRQVRRLLVVSEVALAIMLLVGAGLLIKSFNRLQSIDLGFRTDRLLTMRLQLPATKYREEAQLRAFHRQLQERLDNTPGVESVGATTSIFLSKTPNSGVFNIEGRPTPRAGERVEVTVDVVSPNYHQVMGTPLVKGRAFTEQDAETAPMVVIINETFARRFFPVEDPTGKRINYGDETDQTRNPWRTIVGVVADTRRNGFDAEPRPESYVPLAQAPPNVLTYIVRSTSADPSVLTASVRNAVREIDPDQPVFDIKTINSLVSDKIAQRRLNTILLGVFAAVALILASVGIFGVMNYTVTQRTHEIGIRLALGAQKADVVKMVVGQGMMLALIGVGVGLFGAFVVTRLMASLLYGVSATDPIVFAAVALLLAAVAVLACYIPARRAMRVDPMIALRYE
ncbi:MAG: ABC transporter permease [Pyrinomonadaceae bacterium]